jgi:SAM-dependent methyltransferase
VKGFQDHFSALATGYATFRPSYPPELFAFLADLSAQRAVAWDCATGTGQAALGLAGHFAQVIATDASAAQIAHAVPHPRISYRVASAEASGLADASVDLVTVAQAAHWFDLPAFYAEVRRVLRPGGVLALWGYERLIVPNEIAETFQNFYEQTLAGFWPPERHFVETGYRDLPFPLAPLMAPEIALRAEWNLPQLLGYFGTWSAVKRCREATGCDPLLPLAAALESDWGSPAATKPLKWPTFWKLGRI